MPLMLPWQVAPGAILWRKNTLPFFVTVGNQCAENSCWVAHEQFSSNRMWYKLVLNPVDDALALLRRCDMLLSRGKGNHVVAMQRWEFLYVQYFAFLCQRILGLYYLNKIIWRYASDLHRATWNIFYSPLESRNTQIPPDFVPET